MSARVLLYLALFACLLASLGAADVARAAGGAERISMSCEAEWNPATGVVGIYLFAPDTPATPVGPSGFLPFTGGSGFGEFTPSGQANVVCHGTGWSPGPVPFSPPFVGTTQSAVFRGGQDYSLKGARTFIGRALFAISSTGDWTITFHGSFCGIAASPSDICGT